MGFSDRQMRALSRCVPARHVRSRLREGKELSYVEGWYVLAQANRIFGFDGWDRETVETKCIMGREARGTATAVYAARVRITVRTDDRVIVRDGHGTGEATGQSMGEVHDRALKAAETDATKRALATFGRAFGLALYAGTGGTAEPRNGQHAAPSSSPPPANKPEEAIVSAPADVAPPPATADATTNGAATSLAPKAEAVSPAPEDPSAPAVAVCRTDGAPVREPRQHIDKSALSLREPVRVRDKDHLRYVASQPCLLCSASPSDAHHVRFAQPRAMGRKVGDNYTVPLCRTHHRELHQYGNEASWWHDMGIDPIEIAAEIWTESHSTQKELARPADR